LFYNSCLGVSGLGFNLEHKHTEKCKSLYEVQADIDSRKEHLLSGIEARLVQQITQKELFTIRWSMPEI